MDPDSFAIICRSHGIAPAVGMAALASALFVAGLTGSVAHCGPMCGPLVIAQAGNKLARVSASGLCEFQRLRSGLLLPYHLGRLTTYAALGAAVAMFGETLSRFPWFRFVAASLLATAAGLFVWQAFVPTARGGTNRSAILWSKMVGSFAARISGPGVMNGYGLGLLLGFIPCGLVYAGLAAASATADSFAGAVGMVAFGLGTVPMLGMIGMIGQAAMYRARGLAHMARPVILTLNAGLLFFLASTLIS